MENFDLRRFGARLREVRTQRNETLRTVSSVTKISVPTISRVERGDANAVESNTLLVLSKWANLPLELFGGTHKHPLLRSDSPVSTPDVVELHLRADKNLDPRTAALLIKMFRAAYDEAALLGDE